MQREQIYTFRRARGFTLIELLAVLVILVAVAGLLIATLPNFVEQSHRATGASSMANLNNSVNQFVQLRGSAPNQLDSLLENVAAGTEYAALPMDNGTYDLTTTQTLDANTLASLNGAGIEDVIQHGAGNATYESADLNGTVVPLATGSNITILQANGINTMGLPALGTNEYYAVFGVGRNCTMVGVNLQEPPTHFDADNPAAVYSRFGLVYLVDGDATQAPAEFMGACAFHTNNIVPYWKAATGFRAEQFN